MILRVCILSLAYVTVKRVENKYFRIEIGVRICWKKSGKRCGERIGK